MTKFDLTSTTPQTLGDLDRNEVLYITCECGKKRQEKVSQMLEARMGFIRLDDLDGMMMCSPFGCWGKIKVTRSGVN